MLRLSVISAGSAKDPTLAHLLRCLFFLEARYKFQAVAAHVPGVHNTLADALSRDNMPLFFCLAPQAYRIPSPVPEELVTTLVTPRHWTHETWISWFSTISNLLPGPSTKRAYAAGQRRVPRFLHQGWSLPIPNR